MIDLLDVNVLIALLDPDHIFHSRAQYWFNELDRSGWATCPITENGAIRILGNPKYPRGPGSPGAVVALLRDLRDIEGHEFWPDDLSLLTAPSLDVGAMTSSARVTDTYLLALAVSKGGRFATFDSRLSPAGVDGGTAALHIIA